MASEITLKLNKDEVGYLVVVIDEIRQGIYEQIGTLVHQMEISKPTDDVINDYNLYVQKHKLLVNLIKKLIKAYNGDKK